MGKLGKILAGILVFVILAGIGLAVFVRLYLTDERIKALIIPPAETALGRQVSIGAITVGLFKGITITDFVVKEQDAKTDFVQAKDFILRYELLPLLHKRLVVSEIRFDSPIVRIHRGKNGVFNFKSLPFLAAPAKKQKKPAARQKAASLPVALTIQQIRINQAHVEFTDATKQLPSADLTANARISLDLSQGLSQPRYEGETDFRVNIEYGKLRPHLTGTARFAPDTVNLQADLALETEKIHLQGEVRNLSAPQITLNIGSKSLDIDRVLAMLAELPQAQSSGPKEEAKRQKSATPLAASLPPGLVVKGRIQLDQILYNKLVLRNFLAQYALEKGIFSMHDLTTQVAGGKIQGAAALDLNRPEINFHGKTEVHGLQVKEVLVAVRPQLADMLSGVLEASFTFNGSGTDWQRLQKTLTMEGGYGLQQARFGNTEITRTIAALVGLQELNDLSLESATGSLHIANGTLMLNTKMTGRDVGVESQGGAIGLNGALNMPITLRLSAALSEKLRQRASLTRYLANEKGETVLRLQLTGTVQKPRPALDLAGVEGQAEQAVKKKLLKELDKAISGKDGEQQKEPKPAEQILKGIFGL